jgi:hypothetical protein
MMTKNKKAKTTKKPVTKPTAPKRPMPKNSNSVGRKGALGATSGY